jgi:hypothetical protein
MKKKTIFVNRRWSLFCLVVKKPLVASQHRQFLPVPPAAVQPVQILSRDQKCGNAPAVGSDLNPVQPSAHAQQKCTLEQISDFDGTFQWVLTSFPD